MREKDGVYSAVQWNGVVALSMLPALLRPASTCRGSGSVSWVVLGARVSVSMHYRGRLPVGLK